MIKDIDIINCALISGFMISTQYGQDKHKLMPVSDGDTLIKFARELIKEYESIRKSIH